MLFHHFFTKFINIFCNFNEWSSTKLIGIYYPLLKLTFIHFFIFIFIKITLICLKITLVWVQKV